MGVVGKGALEPSDQGSGEPVGPDVAPGGEQQRAAGGQDPPHLGEGGRLVREEHHTELAGDQVEPVVVNAFGGAALRGGQGRVQPGGRVAGGCVIQHVREGLGDNIAVASPVRSRPITGRATA
jgi:hypothetical protein